MIHDAEYTRLGTMIHDAEVPAGEDEAAEAAPTWHRARRSKSWRRDSKQNNRTCSLSLSLARSPLRRQPPPPPPFAAGRPRTLPLRRTRRHHWAPPPPPPWGAARPRAVPPRGRRRRPPPARTFGAPPPPIAPALGAPTSELRQAPQRRRLDPPPARVELLLPPALGPASRYYSRCCCSSRNRLCWERFGWGKEKADELLLPVLRQYNKHEFNSIRGSCSTA